MKDMMTEMDNELIRLRGVTVRYGGAGAAGFDALKEVDLSIGRGESLGLIGESGSGKTTLGKALIGLVPLHNGAINYEGKAIKAMPRTAQRALRARVQMIFQDPYASLHPRKTIADQLQEPWRIHGTFDRATAAANTARLLERVGLSPEHAQRLPLRFSGGQRQRIAIARALASDPDLIVADEPVSALDVSVQAQILNLLRDLQRDTGLAMLFISHDLSVVQNICDRTAVMYLGRIVDTGPSERLVADPAHPYTAALMSAVPRVRKAKRRKPILLPGQVLSHADRPSGCAFHTRCWLYKALGEPERCRSDMPTLRSLSEDRASECFFADQVASRVP